MPPETSPQAPLEQELERLRSENARLAAERDQLRALFNHAPALICAQHGPEHVYTFTNPIYSQVLGNRELVGLPIREALPEVAGQGFFELLDGVYQTGEPFLGNEMPIMIDRAGDGVPEQAFFNFVYAPLRDEAGVITGILTHAVEVTAMVHAREQLQRSEDRFRSLVRATSQLVWMTDAAGLVEDIPEWRAYTGQSVEEVRGYGWLDALHPDDRPRAEAAWLNAVAGRSEYEVAYRIRNHVGNYEAFIARGTPVLEADGTIREWIGLCVNVEAQRRVEAENERIFESSFDVICTIGVDGYIKRLNGSLSRILGYTDDELRSHPYLHFVHPDDLSATLAEAEKLASGGRTINFENRYLAADGSVRWLNWMCTSDMTEQVFYCIARDVTEQRAVSSALRDREQQYAMVMKATQDAIWDWDLITNRVDWNDGVEALFGYEASQVELTATWWYDHIHPEDAERVVNGIHAVIDHGGQNWSDEYRYRRADGTYALVVDRGYCIHDEAGRPTRMVGAMHDITRARQAEEELKASEARFRQLADAMPQMIFTATPNGDIDYYNQRWYDYTGATFDETKGWEWKPIHHPEDVQRAIDVWSHCVATGELYSNEYRLKRAADGEYRWHLGRGVPVRDAHGRIIKWYGTNTDIHDQKMAELALQEANETLALQQEELQMQTEELQSQQMMLQQANETLALQQEELQMQTEELQSQQEALEQINHELRISEGRIRQLANVMPAIVWAATPEGHLDYYNDHTATYTGLPLDRVIGEGWRSMVHLDDLPLATRAWMRSVASGEPFEHEFRIHHAASGEHRWHIGRAIAMRDDHGRILRWHGACSDIDDQKRIGESLKLANEELLRLSAQAQAANKMKSEFLANMSHELRTPLNSIIGYTELVLMLAAAGLGETERANLEVVLRNARHLLSLINDVLDLSKIEAGKASVHAEAFDPRAVVEAVVGTAAPLAQQKGLSIAAHVAPGLGTIVSDETKVRQILLNLVSNAVKFTKEGRVDVYLEPRGDDRWAVIVADTGIGIATEHQEVVFDEFRQVDASSTRQAGGTGLGLSIARGLARLLGGRLTLTSVRGEGSTFTVELPRTLMLEKTTPTSHAPAAAAPEPLVPEVSTGARIVVAIDDDPEALRLLMEHLRGSGFTVVPAGDGDTGLQLVRELRPAVVTLDVLMPHMDGWQVLGALKADPATAAIPVVVLSFVDNKALGFSLGAAAYLTKPIEREQLLAAVEHLAPGPLDDQYVLVVEDEPDTRSYFRQMLAPTGVKVTEAPDGQAAIDLLDVLGPRRPALVLLDLNLPHVDGFGVLARLRADERTRDVPVIVVTARDLGPDDMSRLAGVRRVVPKGDMASKLALQDLRTLLAELAPGKTPGEAL
jgi:PAS domain S-box-containing protein